MARPSSPPQCRWRFVIWSALVLIVASVVGTPPARAGSLTSSSLASFAEPGAIYLSGASSLPFTLFSGGNSDSVGGFLGGVGAQASGGLSLGLHGIVETVWLPRFSFSYNTANTTTASWSGPLTVGESFFLKSGLTPLGLTKLNLVDPGLWVNVHLLESLHLNASAKACLGGCASLSFKVNVEQAQTIASLNPVNDGSLRVLGAKVAELPATYSTAGDMVKIEAALPNFSATVKNVSPGAPISVSSTQKVGALKIDVAQILANVVGLGIPLSGSKLGFDYTLLSATVGPTIDLRHTFAMQLGEHHARYVFSSPVQRREGAGWGPPTTTLLVLAGDTVELRTAVPTKTLGVVPSFGLGFHTDASIEVVPTVAYGVRALELSGHGIHLGPVINKGDFTELAAIEIDSDDQDRRNWVDAKPFTLTFDPLVFDPDVGGVVDVCAAVDCLSSTFLAAAGSTRRGWFRDEIVRVLAPTDPCLLGDIAECELDETFRAIPFSSRGPSRTAPELEITLDPDALERILALDLVGGTESDDASRRAALRRLGFDLDHLGLPRTIGSGAPFGPIEGDTVIELVATIIPWPGTAVLLLAALAASVRRRRGVGG